MKKIFFIFVIILTTGCVSHPPIESFKTNYQIFSEECASAGYDGEDRNQCATDKQAEYDKKQEKIKKERVKEEKIASAKQAKADREFERKQKREEARARKQQLDAAKSICDSYGIKRGTQNFSACLIQLEQAKQQYAQQLQIQQQQQQAQQAQQQSESWSNTMQGLSNWAYQQQQIQNQQYQQNQQMMNSMQFPTTTTCRNYAGNQVRCVSQ